MPLALPCSLFLLWFVATMAQWIFVFRGRTEWLSGKVQPNARKLTGRAEIVLAVVPPNITFAICAFVLLFSAPTVQFNVGSSLAMELWSFWVHWWERFFYAAGVQAVVYFLWGLVSCVMPHSSWMRGVVHCGFLSSVFGWLLLSMMFPRA